MLWCTCLKGLKNQQNPALVVVSMLYFTVTTWQLWPREDPLNTYCQLNFKVTHLIHHRPTCWSTSTWGPSLTKTRSREDPSLSQGGWLVVELMLLSERGGPRVAGARIIVSAYPSATDNGFLNCLELFTYVCTCVCVYVFVCVLKCSYFSQETNFKPISQYIFLFH